MAKDNLDFLIGCLPGAELQVCAVMGIETPPGGILPTRKAKSQPSTSCATSLASLQGLFIPDCQAKTWAPPCSAPPRSAVHLPPWTLFSHILCTTFPHRQPAWRLSAHPALYPLSVLPALQTQLSTVLALMLDFLLSSWSASVWRQAVCGHIFLRKAHLLLSQPVSIACSLCG